MRMAGGARPSHPIAGRPGGPIAGRPGRPVALSRQRLARCGLWSRRRRHSVGLVRLLQ
jgi:hypothetical protein